MTVLTDTQVVTASGGLVELGYVERTTSVPVSGISSSQTDLGLSVTVVCDGSPILIEFFCEEVAANATAGDYIIAALWQDGSEFNRCTAVHYSPSTAASNSSMYGQLRVTPSAGSHTYSMKGFVANAARPGTFFASAAGIQAYAPMRLRVSKIVQATQWPAVTTGTIICTSSTRPASPFEGQTIYETDTDFTYTYNGIAWTLTGTLGSGFVTASSTTAQGPAGTLTYIHATITVTPGVWVVNSAMSVFNATTSDGTAVGIYNRTTSAIVSGSMGVARETSTSTSGYGALHSAPTKIVVTSNTDLCPYATRNGGSSLQTTNWTGLHGQGVPNGLITAQRLYGG